MTCKERYTNDPEFLEGDKKNLLEPGWAGEINQAELAYIKSELRESPSLRRRWGFRPTARRFNDDYIRTVAMYGLPAKKK